MTSPSIACPVLTHPVIAQADPELLEEILARIADAAPVERTETFPLGTLQPDGRLDLCKQGLGAAGAMRVLDSVVGSPHALHLLLGTNDLRAEGTRALADALGREHHVQTLYLGCNAIDAAAAAPLAVRLAEDETVRALWLKRNPLGDEGIATLAVMLRRNSTIDTLDLVNTGLTLAGLRALAEALADRPRPMQRVFLGGNGLGPDSAPVLAELLSSAGVRELYLAANHLGDEGAAALAAELPGSAVRRMDLRNTGIRGRGAKALLAAVEAGTALTQLRLGSRVPRRIKRAIAALLPEGDAPRLHIESVYR